MGEDEYNDSNMSERVSVAEEDEGDEEEDVAVLSSLENYQLCLKYQQVFYIEYKFINIHKPGGYIE